MATQQLFILLYVLISFSQQGIVESFPFLSEQPTSQTGQEMGRPQHWKKGSIKTKSINKVASRHCNQLLDICALEWSAGRKTEDLNLVLKSGLPFRALLLSPSRRLTDLPYCPTTTLHQALYFRVQIKVWLEEDVGDPARLRDESSPVIYLFYLVSCRANSISSVKHLLRFLFTGGSLSVVISRVPSVS